jgi:hypothetical protein
MGTGAADIPVADRVGPCKTACASRIAARMSPIAIIVIEAGSRIAGEGGQPNRRSSSATAMFSRASLARTSIMTFRGSLPRDVVTILSRSFGA